MASSVSIKGHSVIMLDANTLIDVGTSTANTKAFWAMLRALRDSAPDVKIVVSDGVVKELVRHQTNQKIPQETQWASKRALTELQDLMNREEIFIVRDHTSDHADKVSLHADRFFINTINNYKTVRNIYVITRDVDLMKDIYKTAHLGSLSGHGAKEVHVFKLLVRAGAVVPDRLVNFVDLGDAPHGGGDRAKKGGAEVELPPYKPRRTTGQ